MGRQQKRLEARKNKNKAIKTEQELDTSIKGSTIIKVVIAIAVLIAVLYYVIAVFITKEIDVSGNNDTATSNQNTNHVNNKILASSIFEQKEESYYVYFYDFEDEDRNVANAISSRSDLTIYRVDTGSSLNQNYVTEEPGNKNVTGLEDLKVSSPTLLQVTNDQVTAYYEGSQSITDFLNQ